MNLRPHRPEPPDINLTPLIDVVFLLLIFFMVSTTFRDDGRLPLQLPEADAEPVPADEVALTEVRIERGGRISVNAETLADAQVETLKQALAGALGAQRALPLLIKADAQARHEVVMRVLDAAAQLGLTQIAFAATQATRAGSNVVPGRERRAPSPPPSATGDPDAGAIPASTDGSASAEGPAAAEAGEGDAGDERGGGNSGAAAAGSGR